MVLLLFATTVAQPNCAVPDFAALDRWAGELRDWSLHAAPGCSMESGSPARKVLFLGVDGLRSDAAAMLLLPNLRRLEAMGTSSFWARTQQTGATVSGPGWSSMLTGVETDRHKVYGNDDLTVIQYPTFMKIAKDRGKSVAAAVTWSPLVTEIFNHEDPDMLSAESISTTDAQMAAVVEGWLRDENYDVIFADFDEVDHAGHTHSFDGYDGHYAAAVLSADALIGRLLDAVLARAVPNGEEWLLVLSSDHGGDDAHVGGGHGALSAYNRRVPVIVASNSPRVGIGRAAYEGSHMDVAPTVLHFLFGASGVPDMLDGRPFGFLGVGQPGPPTCLADPTTCGCDDQLQSDYRGSVSTTQGGRTCQMWTSQSPHGHSRTPDEYPDAGLGDHNFCRNPDGEPAAWCYTTDEEVRFELCDVPACVYASVASPPSPPRPPPRPWPAANGCYANNAKLVDGDIDGDQRFGLNDAFCLAKVWAGWEDFPWYLADT